MYLYIIDNVLYNATNISTRLSDGTDQREQQLGPVKHTLKAVILIIIIRIIL